MKKILFMLKHLSLGGAEKMFLRLLNYIDLEQYEVHIKLVFGDQIQSMLQHCNIKVSSIFAVKNDETKKLIKLCPEKIYVDNVFEKYDIEIAFLEGYPTRIISASSNSSSIKVAFIHTDFRFFHHSLNAFENCECEMSCYQKFTKLFFVSKAARDGFHSTYPLLSPKYEYIFYPPLSDRMMSFDEKYEKIPEEPYFITLTRLAPEKGLFKLIDAVKKVKDSGLKIKIKIFGIGPLYNAIIQKIRQENLDECIFLMGYCSTPYCELKNSMGYICPSDNESFGISIEESLFLEVPIIACRCPGTEEILHNGDFGLLVSNSAEGLFGGISEFIENTTLRLILKQKAIKGKDYWKIKLLSSSNFEKLCLPDTNI